MMEDSSNERQIIKIKQERYSQGSFESNKLSPRNPAQVEQKLTAVDSKLAQVPPKSPGPVRSAKTAQPAKEKGKPSSPAEIQTGEFTKASYSTSSSCTAEKVELKSSKI